MLQGLGCFFQVRVEAGSTLGLRFAFGTSLQDLTASTGKA